MVLSSVTYKNLLILATVVGFHNALESVSISHPLQQTTLFIQRHDSIGPNVCRQLNMIKGRTHKVDVFSTLRHFLRVC